jgi:hypothetical protein
MGKFTGWDVAGEITKKCSNCGMTKENKNGCCNDKQETLQLKKDQLTPIVNNVSGNHFVFIDHLYSLPVKSPITFFSDGTQSSHSPPLIQPVSPFILNCVFRI